MFERMSVCGVHTSSTWLYGERYDPNWTPNGVQKRFPTIKHTANSFLKHGHHRHECKQQIAFGRDMDRFWTDVFPNQLVDRFSGDIKKLGRVLKIIKYTMPILGLVPVHVMLKMFAFSEDFGNKMVFPLVTLFLGTGSQTPNVSCAILESLFVDPNMGMGL